MGASFKYIISQSSLHIAAKFWFFFRYPIFNVHDEGSSIFKELAAVKDLVRNGATYAHLYERPLGGFSVNGTSGLEVNLSAPSLVSF